MSDNRDKKAFGLSAVLALAAVMVLGMSIRDGNAAANDTASRPSDQSSLLFRSANTGSVEPAGTMLARKGVKREHGRARHAALTTDTLFASTTSVPASGVALSSSPTTDDGLYARKGRNGGVKFEHGRPGHASATSDESLFARKGGKGGVKFEHGRPGHASTSPEDTLYARKGRPKPERRG